jgi:DNA-binding response OmpR family regulator
MGKRILIFDDDRDILDILSYILADSGYSVYGLDHGHNFFQEVKDFHPDLILMDVMLGDMDGRVICRHLKQANTTQHVPVILISASHDLSQSLKQEGAPNDFIAKPFDLDFLLRKVELQLAA